MVVLTITQSSSQSPIPKRHYGDDGPGRTPFDHGGTTVLKVAYLLITLINMGSHDIIELNDTARQLYSSLALYLVVYVHVFFIIRPYP